MNAAGQTGRNPVFAGNSGGDARQTLDFSASLGTAYDDDTYGSEDLERSLSSKLFTVFTPTLLFSTRADRVHIGATAQSNFRYFGDTGQLVTMNHSVGVGISTQLSRQTSLFVNQSLSYSPGYLYGLFLPLSSPSPGDVKPPGTDAYATRLGTVSSYAYSTNAAIVRSLTRKSSVEVDANYRYTDFSTLPGESSGQFGDLRAFAGGARYKYAVRPDLRVRLDYVYTHAQYPTALQPNENNLYFGVEYNFNELIHAGRRTTISFNAGPTAAKGLLPSDTDRYVLTADASIAHQIGRSWDVRGGFRRGIDYIEGLPGPVLSNATTVSVGGFINRRADFRASLSYSAGQASASQGQTPFDTYTSDALFRYALLRELAVYVEHVTYSYTFDQSLPLPPGVSHDLTRRGVRAGLTLWIPIMRRR